MFTVGTVGSGFIVHSFFDAVLPMDGYDIRAFYTRNEEKAEPFRKKKSDLKVYTDFDEFLKDPMDIVYIASPNSLHYEQAKKALLAGKHVFLEKPFTDTADKAQELIDLAKEKRLYLFETILSLSMPLVHELAEDLPKLGGMKLVEMHFSQRSSKLDAYLAGELPNVFNKAFSGGALRDLGVYNLHLIHYLFGSPKKQMYAGHLLETGVDVSGAGLLDYGDFQVLFSNSKGTTSKNFTLFEGDRGYLYVDNTVQSATGYTLVVDGVKTEKKDLQEAFSYTYEYADFLEILERDDYNEMLRRLEHTYTVTKCLEELCESAGVERA